MEHPFLEVFHVEKTHDSHAALLCGWDGGCGCDIFLWHPGQPSIHGFVDFTLPAFAPVDDEIYDERSRSWRWGAARARSSAYPSRSGEWESLALGLRNKFRKWDELVILARLILRICDWRGSSGQNRTLMRLRTQLGKSAYAGLVGFALLSSETFGYDKTMLAGKKPLFVLQQNCLVITERIIQEVKRLACKPCVPLI